MNTANIGPLLVKLNIDVAQGLFIVGADQIEETPFDLTGTLLVTDLINDETALTNLTDVLKKRFGTNSQVDLYGVALSENNALGKGLPVSDLSTLGASYMTKLEADMGESLTWVLLHRSAENTVRTSENASKIDLTGLEGAEPEEGYEFTLQPLIDVVAALRAQEPGHDKKTLLGGISKGLPALLGAQKLQEKAAKVGFDWDTEPPVWAKFEEEIAEFKEAIAEKDYENAELEGGDVLFSLINLLRWYKIGGENALNRTNNKFRQRFAHVERCVKDSGKSWKDFSLEELDLFWESAKVSEQKHSLK